MCLSWFMHEMINSSSRMYFIFARTTNNYIMFSFNHSRGSDFTSTTATATIKKPLTNQMRLIYPINQSDAYYASAR
jgi:hypothetical protein